MCLLAADTLAVFAGGTSSGHSGIGCFYTNNNPRILPIPRVSVDTESHPEAGGKGPVGVSVFLCLCLREKQIAKKEKAQESENAIDTREVRGLTDTIGEPVFSCEGRECSVGSSWEL